MKILLAIGSGSFIGGILRYLLVRYIQLKFPGAFPFGTLGVNIIGCFLIGLILAYSLKGNLSEDWRIFLSAGVCGGFTTFSSFSAETFFLFQEGQYLHGFSYVLASVLLGILATVAGFFIIKFF